MLSWFRSWWLLAMVVATCAGCGGFRMRKSVSPMDFIAPGIRLQNESPAPFIAQSCEDRAMGAL